MDRDNSKPQSDDSQNGHEANDKDDEEEQQEYRPEPGARELTQTDKLNKRLLESLLERMSKSEGEFDRYMDDKEEEEEAVDLEEESSEF